MAHSRQDELTVQTTTDEPDSRQTQASVNWADMMDEEDDIREQLRLREAEVEKLERENEGLLALLKAAKTFQNDPTKETEDLKLQLTYLVGKCKSLKCDNNKLQQENEASAQKTAELELKLELLERGNSSLRQVTVSLKEEVKAVKVEKVQVEQKYVQRIRDLFCEESRRRQDLIQRAESAENQIKVQVQEIQQMTAMRDDLTVELNKTKEQLQEARNETRFKQQALITEQEKQEQLNRAFAVKEAENEELLRRAEETETLRQQIRELQENNQNLQQLLVRKKGKKSSFSLFRRTRTTNRETAVELIEETTQPKEQHKTAKKKKGFWGWLKGCSSSTN